MHRLVLIAFKGENKERPFCNHIDGVKTNNALENLEWVTKSENNAHAYRTGLNRVPMVKGSKHWNSKLDEQDVREIKLWLKCKKPNGKQKYTARKIAKAYEINEATVGDIKRGGTCLLYTSPSPRDQRGSRMPSSA